MGQECGAAWCLLGCTGAHTLHCDGTHRRPWPTPGFPLHVVRASASAIETLGTKKDDVFFLFVVLFVLGVGYVIIYATTTAHGRHRRKARNSISTGKEATDGGALDDVSTDGAARPGGRP